MKVTLCGAGPLTANGKSKKVVFDWFDRRLPAFPYSKFVSSYPDSQEISSEKPYIDCSGVDYFIGSEFANPRDYRNLDMLLDAAFGRRK
jgi:hypothetical protein